MFANKGPSASLLVKIALIWGLSNSSRHIHAWTRRLVCSRSKWKPIPSNVLIVIIQQKVDNMLESWAQYQSVDAFCPSEHFDIPELGRWTIFSNLYGCVRDQGPETMRGLRRSPRVRLERVVHIEHLVALFVTLNLTRIQLVLSLCPNRDQDTQILVAILPTTMSRCMLH